MFKALDVARIHTVSPHFEDQSALAAVPALVKQSSAAKAALAIAQPLFECANPDLPPCFNPALFEPYQHLEPLPLAQVDIPAKETETGPLKKRVRAVSTEDYRTLINENIGKSAAELIRLPETRTSAPKKSFANKLPAPEVNAPSAFVCEKQARALLLPLNKKLMTLLDKSSNLKGTMNQGERHEALQTIHTGLFLDSTSALGWSMLAALAEGSGKVRMGDTTYRFVECIENAKNSTSSAELAKQIELRLKEENQPALNKKARLST